MVAHLAELLTTAAAARAAGASEQTVRLWMKSGRLPFTATKHGALIDPVTLGRLIGQREQAQREKPRRGAGR
jgi:predicted site-specific integrase-resolvase